MSLRCIGITFATTLVLGSCDDDAPSGILPPGPPHLQFESEIGAAVAGSTLPPVTVTVRDAQGRLVSNATPTITLGAEVSSGGTAVLHGTTTAVAVAGVATFTNLRIETAGGFRLTAAAASITGANSNSFGIQPGPLVKLIFKTQPANGTAGAALPAFSVSCTDAYGNTIGLPPGGSMNITLALGSNPTGAVLSGGTTVSGFSILVPFNNVVVDKPGSGYTLVARSTSPGMCSGFTPVTSTPFNISQ